MALWSVCDDLDTACTTDAIPEGEDSLIACIDECASLRSQAKTVDPIVDDQYLRDPNVVRTCSSLDASQPGGL